LDLVAGGTVSWFVSDGKYSTLHNDCSTPLGCSTAEWNGNAPTIKTLDAVAITGWAVGGAALVGGLSWYFFASPARSTTVGWTFHVDPVSRALGATCRF
jgi:hypothetical protein